LQGRSAFQVDSGSSSSFSVSAVSASLVDGPEGTSTGSMHSRGHFGDFYLYHSTYLLTDTCSLAVIHPRIYDHIRYLKPTELCDLPRRVRSAAWAQLLQAIRAFEMHLYMRTSRWKTERLQTRVTGRARVEHKHASVYYCLGIVHEGYASHPRLHCQASSLHCILGHTERAASSQATAIGHETKPSVYD
jgi:hypothetical protein